MPQYSRHFRHPSQSNLPPKAFFGGTSVRPDRFCLVLHFNELNSAQLLSGKWIDGISSVNVFSAPASTSFILYASILLALVDFKLLRETQKRC